MSLIKRLWNDEAGFIVSAELILIATIAVIGMVVALDTVRNAVTSELSDVAGAIQDVNQSYYVAGVQGHAAATAGYGFQDQTDFCDSDNDLVQADDNCITHVSTLNFESDGSFASAVIISTP